MSQAEPLFPPPHKRRARPPWGGKAVLIRLAASLLVALALFAAPLATPNAAAMAQMNECSQAGTESACPAMDDGATLCTPTICVSVCGPFFLPPAAADRQIHAPAAETVGGPLRRLAGITPETEIRPPRPFSEI